MKVMVCKTVILSLLFCLSGCKEQAASMRPAARILSLSAAAAGVLLRLGAPVAAVDAYAQIADPAGKLPVIGKGTAISREKITEYGIDCILLWNYQESCFLQEKRAGIRIEVIAPLRLEKYPGFIRRMGEIAGKTKEAGILADEFQRKLNSSRKQQSVSPIPVYFELYAPWKTAGQESYIGDLLRLAGFRSIVRRTGVISAEQLIEAAPGIIFFAEGFTSAEEIASRPGMRNIPAVKKNRIYAVPRRFLVEGLEPFEAVEFLKKRQE